MKPLLKRFLAFVLAGAAFLIAPLVADFAAAQTPSPARSRSREKLNAYVGCINRLSERSYESRSRYFSWAAKTGPTGKERIIYGTYTIYDTSDCQKNVEKANALEPRDAELEAAASAYAEAVTKLEPLLKEADDYYAQENYKDDKMAKGKALHPRLVAAWDAFASADQDAARRRRSHQRQTRAGEARRDRAERRQAGALPCRGADDPGQARAARGGVSRSPTSPRSRRRSTTYEEHRQGGRRVFRLRRRRQDRLDFHRQRQVVPGHGEAADAPHPRQGAVQFRRQDDARMPAAAPGWSRAPRRGCCATTIS